MEVGTLVKIEQPKIQGKKGRIILYKFAKVLKDYDKFVLVQYPSGIRECFFKRDLIIVEENDDERIFL